MVGVVCSYLQPPLPPTLGSLAELTFGAVESCRLGGSLMPAALSPLAALERARGACRPTTTACPQRTVPCDMPAKRSRPDCGTFQWRRTADRHTLRMRQPPEVPAGQWECLTRPEASAKVRASGCQRMNSRKAMQAGRPPCESWRCLACCASGAQQRESQGAHWVLHPLPWFREPKLG